MVSYVDTVNGFELRNGRGLRGLGEPIAAGLLLSAAGGAAQQLMPALNTAAQNWLPAVTGATGASIFAKGVEDLSAAEEAAANARLIRFALGIGGAILAGVVIYKRW